MDISTFYNPLFNTLNIAYLDEDKEFQVVIHKLLDYTSKYYKIQRPFFMLENKANLYAFTDLLSDEIFTELINGGIKRITDNVEKVVYYHSPNKALTSIFTNLN